MSKPERAAWKAMQTRCYGEGNDSKPWRDKGIKVCSRWLNSFDDFLADVGPKPSLGHSLDRYPNNDGNYEPGNVRWATRSEQNRNRQSFKWAPNDMKKPFTTKFAKDAPAGLLLILEHFGGNAALADYVGCSRQRTHGWKKNGIPLKYAEVLTKGTGLKAREIWPEIYEIFVKM